MLIKFLIETVEFGDVIRSTGHIHVITQCWLFLMGGWVLDRNKTPNHHQKGWRLLPSYHCAGYRVRRREAIWMTKECMYLLYMQRWKIEMILRNRNDSQGVTSDQIPRSWPRCFVYTDVYNVNYTRSYSCFSLSFNAPSPVGLGNCFSNWSIVHGYVENQVIR